ncbi:putative pyoverdine/dityrosine biosynthesis protein [Septoria linicola]|nr:putative pyoverdine/dityrosine biosynthesis protein [Septoria linicola]
MDSNPASGSSIYDRFIAFYARRHDGALVHCTNQALRANWAAFPTMEENFSTTSQHKVRTVSLVFTACSGTIMREEPSASVNGILLEQEHGEDLISGIIIKPNASGSFDDLDVHLMNLILRSARAGTPMQEMTARFQTDDNLVDEIADLFNETLRNVTPGDQWAVTGREYFTQRLKHFTRHSMRLQFALPAFPCKSSNLNKVGGNLPDLGEMIALTTLHKFVMDIEHLYAPGATVLIVSDGHVFSDCIGVDDSMVDRYSKHLCEMNDALSKAFHDDGRRRVCLRSLTDMLQTQGDDIESATSVRHLSLGPISHHIERVQINDDAELCRRLLMQGFKADAHQLQNRIQIQDPATLRLYRGFSRFMLEDLENNIYTKHLSKTQRRKLSSKVAFEMIERNQAYSNLVEVMLPNHIRLSIHAHDNAGPKFGINLMGPEVRATDSLPPNGRKQESCDLLHVPTPWHGCIVEVAGDDHLYLAKVEHELETSTLGY